MITIYSLAALLLLASQSVTAQLAYPDCPSSWSWSLNSLGQSPCTVAAYLQGVCNDEDFTIPPLHPGDSYTGPTGPGDATDLCKCNTVVYSLMSACDACQGAQWLPWKTWTRNCTAVDPPTTFSRLIPTGTRVPEWAFLNVTKGTWDPVLAFQVGDAIEVIAGETGTLAVRPTPTTTQTVVPGLSHPSKRKIGAVIGGIVGGVVVVVVAALGLFLWHARVKRRKATREAAAIIFGNRALPLREKGAKSRDGSHEVPMEAI
ncbi:hypothetical protein BJV78DRAFT_177447 [Lactifluus subvellereus]|nr:hypothetical protein BJV78DRAFT_177447 [Lactifluus subvellereus]